MVCFVVAFGFPKLAAVTSRKFVHGVSLALGGLSLISVYFVHDPFTLQFCMVGVGIAWASILSMPYAILSNAIPANRTGVYMGVFNFFIVIPEIAAALSFQPLVMHVFHNDPLYVVIMGGVSMLIAAALVVRVQDAEVHSNFRNVKG
jgi:maltose/moltooligosaccharide transporter